MAYSDRFTARFSQSSAIEAAISQANPEARFDTVRDGVCQTISVLWLINNGWTSEGLGKLTNEDVNTSKGVAFWRQVLGAQRDFQKYVEAWARDQTTREDCLTENFQLLSKSSKRLTLDLVQARAADLARDLLTKSDYSCYLRFQLPQSMGHGCAIHVANSGNWVFFDPNFGNCAYANGTGPRLADALTDAQQFYHIQELSTYRLT